MGTSPKGFVSLCLIALMSFLVVVMVEPRAINTSTSSSSSFSEDGLISLIAPQPPKPPQPAEEVECPHSNSFCRHGFPKDFLFGTASSAYQFEGAGFGGGRGMTIWDDFSHRQAERVVDHTNGDIAVDFLHRYKEDIQLMKDMNMNAFRFSISWTRILPHGRVRSDRYNNGINEKGIQFYNNLIDELLANGIQPAATLYHWETPLVLEEEYNGLLDKKFVKDFKEFSKICFEKFGDRVKNWATFNEPYVISVAGYNNGKKAPGRCSKWMNKNCDEGDSSTEPYLSAHHLLLAHIEAVKEYKTCAKCKENGGLGQIGIVTCPPWFEPVEPRNPRDIEAVQRALDFTIAWHLDPLIKGDYPESMKKIVNTRLPKFEPMEKAWFKANPLDFIGINYYGAFYTRDGWYEPGQTSYDRDMRAPWEMKRKDQPLGPNGAVDICEYAIGLRRVLNHLKKNYPGKPIYIMENGYGDSPNDTLPLEAALNDADRKRYYIDHMYNLQKAICEDKVNVKGYFAWSMMDNYEWQAGYTVRFGLYHVDYNDNLKRYPKESAKWFKEFLREQKQEFTGYLKTHTFDFLRPEADESNIIDVTNATSVTNATNVEPVMMMPHSAI